MKVLDIALTSLRRFVRDRSNIFFVFVFPLLLVLAIGLVFGGGTSPSLGVVYDADDALAADVYAALQANESIEVERFDDRDELELAVERQTLSAGLVVPDGYGAALLAGEAAVLDYFAQPGSIGSSVGVAVDAAVADQSVRLRAATVVAEDGDLAAGLAAVDAVEVPGVDVRVEAAVGSEDFDFAAFGQFGFGAAQNLALFVWVTSLTTSAYLIQNRQLGVVRRMAATPTGSNRILLGELLGRFGIAAIQALFVVAASSLLFGVQWGPPLAAAALILVYCLVGTGAGMLLGSLLNSEEQAASIGLGLGLGLSALGGAMVPLEIFSDGMNRLAHTVTPHAWLIDGLSDLVARDGGFSDIALELGVLGGAGVVLTTAAALAFRRAVIRAL